MPEPEALIEVMFERLAADAVPTATADVILAALSSSDDLDAALAGEPVGLALGTLDADPGEASGHIFLSSVTVAGFRGVGPERTLELQPRPGLTLVAGRNGSGKSSFAEAIELSLTGDSVRWAEKNSVWRTGWRNLHAPLPCAIVTGLSIDGVAKPTTVRRSWSDGALLEDAEVRITAAAGKYRSLAELGLARPLSLYRPFLTAADLGKLIAATPSALFDALGTILGLEGLGETDQRLGAALRAEEQTVKGVRATAADLRTRLADVADDRAERAATVLAKAPSAASLETLDAILAEPLDSGIDAFIKVGQQLADIRLDSPEVVASLAKDIRASAVAAGGRDATVSRIAARVADLLRLSLAHQEELGDVACPVCRTGRLDADWRARATTSLGEMEAAGAAAATARRHLTELVHRASSLGAGIDVPDDAGDIDVSVLRDAVTWLRAMPSEPVALADHLVATYPDVVAAASAVRTAALSWLQQRDSAWRQIAGELQVWLASARQVVECERRIALLKAARAWLKASGEKIRNERLEPFAKHSQQIWQELRQESNVELGAMTLAGTNTRRHVEFPVSVDGVDNGTALGVMSQGEMHALGLATFLPRSCAAESPFRFVVIDDPVQSMDPAKVDGLARVLATLAEDRQVVVFTHDSRLPNAVSRLDIDAEVLEVVRAEQSVVTIRRVADPVERYLDDAIAIAKSSEIDEDVRRPVVAELCRSAIEAACGRAIWRRRLGRGDRHVDVEALIERAKTTRSLAALALFDDVNRGDAVSNRLKQHGQRAADAFRACLKGVHDGYVGSLPELVADTRFLTKAFS